ncbi:hypothetical protein [Streptomyces lasiicapitis]|uniref:hypothetical protein n=1 Tax=Streptomyces lasiicapitis TaxID=1923961 RepID=UPI003656B22D
MAAALRTNACAQEANPRHSIAYLNPDRIAAHLLQQWQLTVDADLPRRDAAARDRAFRSFDSAVESACSFYLGAVARASSRAGSAAASDSALI